MQRRKENKATRINFRNLSKETVQFRNKSKEELDEDYIAHCVRITKDPKFKKSKEKYRNQMLKRCQECSDFINSERMLYCIYCQDAYHSYCLNPPYKKIPANRECIVCPKCKEEKKKDQLKQLTLNDIFSEVKTSTPTKSSLKKCGSCKEIISTENKAECEKCKKLFHTGCFTKDKIVCEECEKKISVALRATKISDYFKTEKFLGQKREKDKINQDIKSDFDIYQKISEKVSKTLKNPNRDGHMKLPKQLSKKQKEIMMKSLFRALQVKNIQFNDDLVFIDKDCPSEMNNSMLESGINPISAYNKKIYEAFKERSRKGEYAPVEVIDDPIQRFIVRAIDDIQMNTIICEYTGEVTLLRKTICNKNDSIMELIRSPSANTSLVICPEKYGNLARFLSGVNNHNAVLKKKQNVYSIRMEIDGSVHILLLAMKNIKKGEILYYDYNAGGYDEYPTEHFV